MKKAILGIVLTSIIGMAESVAWAEPVTPEAMTATAESKAPGWLEDRQRAGKKMSEFKMEQIVVTGTKSERVLSDAPVRTEVITSEALAAKGAANLYEALDNVVGVRVEQQCSFCNFTQVRMQGLTGDHVQILIDGQPVYSGLAAVYGLQQIPASFVERIEIVKGASSALYGNKAISGVINIITKKSGNKPAMEVSAGFGTHNTNEYSLAASMPFNDQVDMLIAAQKGNGDIIDENGDLASDRVCSDDTSMGFRINIREIAGNDALEVHGRSIQEMRKGGELPADYENPFAEGSEHIATNRLEGGLGYQKEFGNKGRLSANYNYTVHHRNATNDTFVCDYLDANGAYPGSDQLKPYLADEYSNIVDVNYGFPVELGGEHFILSGITATHNYLNESGMYAIVDDTDPHYGAAYLSESLKEAYDTGAYVQDEWSLGGQMDMVVGGRYDLHKSKTVYGGGGEVGMIERELDYDENAFTPRAGFSYEPLERLKIRVNVGQGFRVPYGFSEDLHLCSGSPRVYKGSDLKPEKSVSYNLSVDYAGVWYSASANIYRTDLNDHIGLADAAAGSEASALGYDYVWENLGNAHTQGMELAGEVDISKDLAMGLNTVWTDARYDAPRADWVDHPVHGNRYAEDSKYLSRVPEMTAGLNVSYQPGPWKFSVDANWIGRQYIDYNADDDVTSAKSEIVRTAPYVMMTVSAAYTFADLGLTLFAGAKNALNEIQTDKRPDDAAFIYKPLTGRILYAGMRMAF